VIRFACLFALCATAVNAQSAKLNSPEISALLTGNTAVGKWGGTPYRQYFGTDGKTIVAQPQVPSVHGQWRVEDDELQSRRTGDTVWEGWFVMEYAGVWYWVSKTTPPTSFEVVQGEHLTQE